MNDIKVVAIGEFLWDCLPNGKKLAGQLPIFVIMRNQLEQTQFWFLPLVMTKMVKN